MSANQADFPITVMARTLGVLKAGYYAWADRQPSARRVADVALLKRIRTVHLSSHETYGAPRVHADLREQGERHPANTGPIAHVQWVPAIARLMREAGFVGASHRPGGPITTRRDREVRPAPDLVDRNFAAAAPNQLWVADITYVPTAAGFFYLAVVLDAFSRRIVGWAMANHLRSELVLDALEMAVTQRRPRDVIRHSDQGSQYTSLAFGSRCQEAGVRPSMGSVGDAYDNAMAESFFSTLECELLARRRFRSQAEARMACSATSRASTIRSAGTRRLDTAPPSSTSRKPSRTRYPSPSSAKPSNRPQKRGNPTVGKAPSLGQAGADTQS